MTNHPLDSRSTSDEGHSVKNDDASKKLSQGTTGASGSSATTSTQSYAMATKGGGGSSSAPDKNK